MQKNSAGIKLKGVTPCEPDDAFDPETETIEPIGPYSFIQKRSGNRYTQDSILLVNFVLESIGKDSKIIDLGAGTGVMPILIAAKTTATEITGVEVVDGCAALAERNVRLNGLSSRIKIVAGDYRNLGVTSCESADYPEGSFDIVISNPPYAKAGAGRQSPDPARRIGRSEVMGGLQDMLAVSSHLAGNGGRMFFVFPSARLDEMISEMDALGIKPMRILREEMANGKKTKVFFIEAGIAGC
ncbi:MAG: methyltransferase [Deltaproteobacteria bacterium]|nr:methyltransferase [Deltaproteobacteria bacterium]